MTQHMSMSDMARDGAHEAFTQAQIEHQRQLLATVYIPALRKRFDRAVHEYHKAARERIQEAHNAVVSDSRQMDKAITGKASDAIRTSVSTYAKELLNLERAVNGGE
ncbi:hypothetical protein EJ419_04275 [Alloscardovia theropitheci]|uniref:Uncharacterized protein n=1 Tax=Alloscardovia theropitheci TaxID=2496842 RepID=A0A4R0QPS7_9BIFI|nr:hypothetical protein [Alloscardovia theropitheci]TCD54262.1 hypothetical protein EJ419_04275 [Alloscardovia theropitheci]